MANKKIAGALMVALAAFICWQIVAEVGLL